MDHFPRINLDFLDEEPEGEPIEATAETPSIEPIAISKPVSVDLVIKPGPSIGKTATLLEGALVATDPLKNVGN